VRGVAINETLGDKEGPISSNPLSREFERTWHVHGLASDQPGGSLAIRRGVAEILGALAWSWTKILIAASLEKPQGRRAVPALRALGGLLGPVEGIQKSGEGLGVSRVSFPVAKVPNHFAHHLDLAGVLPFVEKVIVNADGKQNVPMFAVFLLQGALDFANDGRGIR